MITALLLAYVALIALSTLVTVGNVGKPRPPITPGVAVATVLLNAASIAGLLYVLVALR